MKEDRIYPRKKKSNFWHLTVKANVLVHTGNVNQLWVITCQFEFLMINLYLNSINCSFMILCFTYRCGRCTAALSLPRGGPEVRTLPPPDEVPSVSGRHSDQHWPRAGDLRLVYVCPHRLLLVIRNVCFKFNQMCFVSMILKYFVVLYVCFLLRKNVA